MTDREKLTGDLLEAVKTLDPEALVKVIAFAREALHAGKASQPDEESQAWMDAELTPALEVEDWSDVPRTGRPIRWDPTQSTFVVLGGQDAD